MVSSPAARATRRRTLSMLAITSLLSGMLLVASGGSAVAQHSASAVLPDLAMLQPTAFNLELTGGGVRYLRFSTTIVNLGPGRFDAFGSNFDPADSSKLTTVTQRLEQGGGWVEHPTAATMFYAGDGHNHWHVYGLQDWTLAYQATPNEVLARGAKTGFCFWDNYKLFNATKYYDGSQECKQTATGTVPMGLSVGWGDTYPWYIAFQYIDVTALPVGDYCLTVAADPRHEFIEADTANNVVQTLINLQPTSVTKLAEGCSEAPPPTSTPTDLTAVLFPKGAPKVDLAWTAGASSIDVFRQRPGESLRLIATTNNSGSYRDNLGKRATSGTYTYRVCDAGSTVLCSNEDTVAVP